MFYDSARLEKKFVLNYVGKVGKMKPYKNEFMVYDVSMLAGSPLFNQAKGILNEPFLSLISYII